MWFPEKARKGKIVDEQFIKFEDTVALMEPTYNG